MNLISKDNNLLFKYSFNLIKKENLLQGEIEKRINLKKIDKH